MNESMDLHVKPKTWSKKTQEKTSGKLVRQRLLRHDTNGQIRLHENEGFCSLKNTGKRIKRPATDWEETLTNPFRNKDLFQNVFLN